MQALAQPATPTNTYRVVPIFEMMLTSNNKNPRNSLPIDVQGTIQSNADKQALVDVTLYNAHGILVNSNPNSLIAKI